MYYQVPGTEEVIPETRDDDGTVVPASKTLFLRNLPAIKTHFFPEHGAPQMYNNKGGVPFPLCGPPPIFLLGQHTAV